ncbi:helical backbone metal receptor [Ilumatobacter sp.]|uniref:helical backbone metal receptor n=1 Tax=Ilumatobacter sp. TaxID=1967498 RepID=UPI003B51CAE2
MTAASSAPRSRIVSLVPSSTETLLWLGADVVACTRFCEQPEIAHVGGTKNPDVAAIVELAPDLVVLDREENRLEDHDALVAAGLDVLVSDVTDVAGAMGVVDALARAVGVRVADVAEPRPAASSIGRRAFVPIWRRPWMTISGATYGASLLAHLGIGLVDVGAEGAYPTVELADVARLEPDLVLVPSEPYVFGDDHVAELATALPGAAVERVDGQDLFWWGSRTPGALDRLAARLG